MTSFGRLLGDLHDAGVRFVLVGGIAVIRHGYVRATRDIDAVIAGDHENLAAVRSVIDAWEATQQDGSPIPEDAVKAGRNLHLRTPHGDIDLLAELNPPFSYQELRDRADVKRVDGVEAPIVSLADLIALKRMAGREQDLSDLRNLEEAHGSLPEPEGEVG